MKPPLTARALVALVAFVVGSSCRPDNSLGGSLSELIPLDISRTEVARNEEALQVSYFRNSGRELDLVIRLTVAIGYPELLPGGRVPLQGESRPGLTRTTVIHLPGGEPTRVLPNVKLGDLRLHEGGLPGEISDGDFSMSFDDVDAFGGGRTLEGTFRAMTVDAGF